MDAIANRAAPLRAGKFVCVSRSEGDRTVVTIIGDIDVATGPVVRDVIADEIVPHAEGGANRVRAVIGAHVSFNPNAI